MLYLTSWEVKSVDGPVRRAWKSYDWDVIDRLTEEGLIDTSHRAKSAYLSVEMIRSVMGGEPFKYPVGTYVSTDKYNHIMMAMATTLDTTGAHYEVPQGTAEENAKLDASYEHLCKMRDELVTLNIVPAISEWSKVNPNL